MNSDGLASLIADYRSILTAKVAADPYLADVARRSPTHRFLGNVTQAVYQRQVDFLARILASHTQKAPGDLDVLDWGCGKGHIAYLLTRRGFRVTACDTRVSRDDSAFGQSTPIIDEQGISVTPLDDPVKLPFESASFDCVVSFGVLEHVADDLGSLKEIRRVLRPGGLFYVTFLPYALSWTQVLARLRGNNYHDRLYWRRRVHHLATVSRFSVRALWFGQLLPKNSVPFAFDSVCEPLDRILCRYTPLKYFATNLEAVLAAE
jgi:SAM-dependent methyltransferase